MHSHKKINILVDCHVFKDSFQGTRTYIEGIYSELIKDKEFNFFLASDDLKKLEQTFGKKDNITFVEYKNKNKFLRLLIDIPLIVKQYNIDYAHFQYTVPPKKRCSYIVTTHDVLFLDFPEYFPKLNILKNKFLYKWSARLSDIKLTVSNYSKQKIEKHLHTSGYIITHNAVSDDFFDSYDKKATQKKVKEIYGLKNYIIYVSRWEPRKNHMLVLKAFVEAKLYEKHQLLFIGDKTFDVKEYNEIYNVLDQKIRDNIFCFRKTDFQTMLLLLRGATASVYPSIAEGFGIPPLEAIAAKIPTICSANTAMSDFTFLKDFYFDPLNQAEFTEKLIWLLNNDFSTQMEDLSKSLQEMYNWKNSAAILRNAIISHKNSIG